MSAILTATNIRKKYGHIEILKGIDLAIQSGEMVALVGSSGAGKSTFLHILGTLTFPDSGQVRIEDVDLANLSNRKLSKIRNEYIGFVFQFHQLLPEFTVLENVCIPAWIAQKNTDKQIKKTALEFLDFLGIQATVEKKPDQLSGGEQQRVAVARALINSPRIILADEPTGNLDSHHAQDLQNLFRKLAQSYNQTFLIATHNEQLAQQCDRTVHMHDGTISSS
ncbi:MAG: ABC transporter ATP-binding protein [Phycisphaerales bacterium]|nr:ABC transporter ATP-binding protein [Phycisphaerales bacterium]